MDARRMTMTALDAVLVTVRYAAFIPLYALRRVIRGLLNMIGGAGYLSVIVLIIEKRSLGLILAMAATGTVAFALAWAYDTMLLKLSPRPLVLIQ